MTLTPNIDASEERIGHLVYVFLDEFPLPIDPKINRYMVLSSRDRKFVDVYNDLVKVIC